MARRSILSAATLEQLGVSRLAELLLEQAARDKVLKSQLTLLCAGEGGDDALTREIDRRLAELRRARRFLDWDEAPSLAAEIDTLRGSIAEGLGSRDPARAAERLWTLLGMSAVLLERVDDSNGTVAAALEDAVTELGTMCAAAPTLDPEELADRLVRFQEADEYGIGAGLLPALDPALGVPGRARVRELTLATLAGLSAANQDYERHRLAGRLQQLADLERDVDAFMAAAKLGGSEDLQAAAIARRLLDAGRPSEALDRLDAPQAQLYPLEAAEMRIEALDALGRKADAQSVRWETFASQMSLPHLKEHLRRLPDFEDAPVERRAVDVALSHPRRHAALSLLVAWPRLEAADRLVRAEIDRLDGRDYGTLRPAAEALCERYPLAATLLYRRMALDVLRRAASEQYAYAVRDVAACASLAAAVPDDGSIETHDAFMARLRAEHGRKYRFWERMEAAGAGSRRPR